ncbi:MAG: CoA transferase [Proteobacteria bacterium]|nr:CoA transferase [Pseudomonadota bacterium]
MTASGPLSGVTVVDMTRILAGPYCTLMMAELGARVIKIEPPKGGDDARQYGPFTNGKSTYFVSVNRGKESIALDLKSAGDKQIFEALLGRADVVVENFRPGTMEKLGYGWETLHPRYPKLIYAAASGFGHTGPYSHYPAYDMVVQGIGGIMSVTGEPGGGLTRVGMSIGDIGAGLYTTIAVNAALYHRAQTGEATKVDIGMFDCQLALLENAVMRYTTSGTIPGPMGARHPSITPFEAYKTKDGNLIIAAGNDAIFVKLCRALARPDLADNPQFKTNDLRNTNNRTLATEIEKELAKDTTHGWMAVLEKADVPSSCAGCSAAAPDS